MSASTPKKKKSKSAPKPAPPSGEKLTSNQMAVNSAKHQAKAKKEEDADKNKLSFVQRTKNKFANNILSSKKGVMAIDIIEQQGELGVDIAEGVRKRAVTHKEYLVSKMDAGELKRMELDKLTSRFNAGLPMSDLGTGELHDAIRENNNNQVIKLLSQSYDVDEIDKRTGYTALMTAAKECNKAGARLLLENGAEVRYQNRRGATALHFACKNGEAQIARFILDRAYECRCVSILIDLRDTDGRSARDIAQGRGETQLIAKLDAAVKEEAAVKAVEDMLDRIDIEAEVMYASHNFRNGSTALHWLLENGNMEFFSADRRQQASKTTKKIVLLGADVNDGDSAGRKPLHYAAMSCGGGGPAGVPNTACARALFRACEDPPVAIEVDAVDDMGMTALYYAVERGSIDFCELLLKRGCDIHFVLKPSGYSYLHACAQRNFGEGCDGIFGAMAEWLVDEDVDHNLIDDYGRTAKMISQDVGTLKSRFVTIIVKAEDDQRQRAYRVKALMNGKNYKK